MVTRVEGRARFLKAMQALPVQVRKELKTAIQKSANELADAQRRLAPVDDGELKKSIKVEYGTRKGRGGATVAGDPELTATVSAGDKDAFYAPFVEFGTSQPGSKAQPFFFPTYRALKKRIKGRLTRAMRKGLKNVGSNA